jgi:hypothetical protein
MARRLYTNFSKGELSPKIESRPDLAAYFEGGSAIENFLIMRQGGLERRWGLRFIDEVKDHTKDTVLLPFEASVDDAFIIEAGHLYTRFYMDKQLVRISAGGAPVEVASPYTEAQLRSIHFTQSVDVLFMFHEAVQQRRLSRISDTNWSLSAITATPPPSFEKDTDISGGTATLTPGATTGTGIIFTASAAVFLEADVGRQIIFGASRATITAFGRSAGDTASPNDEVRATILDAFPDTNPIPAGSWLLRLSPQATLDPDKKEPEGALVTLVASINAFRSVDVGKFITIYGGLVQITEFVSATQVKGIIRSEMTGTQDANPAAAAAGAWTLEVESWSTINGFPRTGEFFQGRLGQAGTLAQLTTFWLSKPDDFDSYAVGATAANAIEYTIAARKLNRVEWITDRDDLFAGTSGAELRITSGKTDEPFGGDVIPVAKRFTAHGSAPVQPVVIGNRILFLDRSRKKVLSISFDLEQDGYDTVEITGAADHIMGSGVRLGALAITQRADPRIYFVREDGQLVALTFFHKEKVIGFTRIITDGTFESVAVKPHPADSHGGHDEVWVIVKRTINGQVRRYVEMFEDHHEPDLTRPWDSLQTDSAVVYSGAATTVISGLGHLEGETVDVVADGGFRGTKVVSGGQITLTEAASEVEVGLHYDSKCVTMRPAIEGQIIEGIPRSWNSLWVRVRDTIGGHVNGEKIQYSQGALGSLALLTGDRKVATKGWGIDGRVTVEQREPYPMQLLAIFGTLEIGGND